MAVSRLDTVVLASNVSTNGTQPGVVIPVNGLVSVYFSGTFGGGTAQLQISPDYGVTWMAASGTVAAAAIQNIQVVATGMRVNIAGTTGASISVSAVLPDYN